jgi:alcohol dehydrogenase class IV
VAPFTVEMPAALHVGPGCAAALPNAARVLGTRVLLVTGTRSFESQPRLAAMARDLPGCVVSRLACADGEPTEASVDAAATAGAEFSPDVVVGIGGGSVLDTAKALSALLKWRGPCRRFLEGFTDSESIPGPGLPWIAVPTTAGTGSEVTKNAVIASPAAGAKRSMRSPFLLASTVFVDAELTLGLPAGVTGASGLDALTQLVEAYLCRKANPFTASLVEGAFPLMLEALEGLAADPGNLSLRQMAGYGAMVSGIALANAGLGAAHGFAAAVGPFHVPHGLACAVFLPHVLAANAEVIREPLGRLLGTLAPARLPLGADPVNWLSDRVRSLLDAYGLPGTLAGFGIPRARVPELAQKSMGSSMRGNPRDLDETERQDILAAVLQGRGR